MESLIQFQSTRRFGAELELNTEDGVVRKLDDKPGQTPKGASIVANLITKAVNQTTQIHTWHHTANNESWIVKPDSSCGIEVCTPILKGWAGLKSMMRVSQSLRDYKWPADRRCSFHVHLNISDMDVMQLASVIAWYIKCEPVFLDAMADYRKCNRYCQCIGASDLFQETSMVEPNDLIMRVSGVKYYSLNAYHFVKGGMFSQDNQRKQTIEFRIAENDACLDPYYIKNWVRLLLHFVDVVKDKGLPQQYFSPKRPMCGLLWLDPIDVFKVLKFDQPLSEGLNQTKQWFAKRIVDNSLQEKMKGIWSVKGRIRSFEEAKTLLDPNYPETPTEEMVWGKKYVS